MNSNIEVFVEKLKSFDLDAMAKATGFVQRADRGITPLNFLVTFFALMQENEFGYENWALSYLSIYGDGPSKQAINKRVTPNCLDFVEALFAAVFEEALLKNSRIESTELFDSFNKVLIEDSTCLKVGSGLVEVFSGPRVNGKKVAQSRVQLLWNMSTNFIESVEMTPFSENDVSYSSTILEFIKEKDLIIRDLGYWNIRVYSQIDVRGAYFVSRIKTNTRVKKLSGNDLCMYRWLNTLDRRGVSIASRDVLIGNNFKVRMIVEKLPETVANERRKKNLRQRNFKSRSLKNKAHYCLGWTILITNVPSEIWSRTDVVKAYSLRWQIEIIFRSWKSQLPLAKLTAKGAGSAIHKPKTLIRLFMLYILLFLQPTYNFYFNKIKAIGRFVSPEKFIQLARRLPALFLLQYNETIRRHLLRSACFDRRNDRKPLIELIFRLF